MGSGLSAVVLVRLVFFADFPSFASFPSSRRKVDAGRFSDMRSRLFPCDSNCDGNAEAVTGGMTDSAAASEAVLEFGKHRGRTSGLVAATAEGGRPA